ncbi:MAG: DUF3619 family protein [Sterolibacterium sp.]|nr:DUF3619 family protein [Sterolibacterium sp.]
MNNHLHDEQQLGHRIGQVLNRAANHLDLGTQVKLQAARRYALTHQKTAVVGLSMAGVGYFASEVLLPKARTVIALVMLAIGVVGTYYWNNFQQAAENEEIDSALLSDELPINAYLDHGFSAWLEHSSPSSPE